MMKGWRSAFTLYRTCCNKTLSAALKASFPTAVISLRSSLHLSARVPAKTSPFLETIVSGMPIKDTDDATNGAVTACWYRRLPISREFNAVLLATLCCFN